METLRASWLQHHISAHSRWISTQPWHHHYYRDSQSPVCCADVTWHWNLVHCIGGPHTSTVYDGSSSERFKSRPKPRLLAFGPTSVRAAGKRGQRWVEGTRCHLLTASYRWHARQGRLGDWALSAVSHLIRGIRASGRVSGWGLLPGQLQLVAFPFLLPFHTSPLFPPCNFPALSLPMLLDASFSPPFPFQPLIASSRPVPPLLNLHRWGNEAEN